MNQDKTGLIITVGFSPEPIEYTIKKLKPSNTVFISSKDSIDQVVKIQEKLQHEKHLTPHETTRIIVEPSKSSDTIKAVYEAKNLLETKGIKTNKIILDSTGGTKPMTAGAIIAATLLNLKNIYTHVEYDPTTHKPLPPSMKLIELSNPIDYLGFLEARLAIDQINNHNYQTATYMFQTLSEKVTSIQLRYLYQALATLSQALDAWDKFDHKKALEQMEFSIKLLENYNKDINKDEASTLIQEMKEKTDILKKLNIKEINPYKIIDLLANAERHLTQGRYDDSSARSYRTLEAIEQYALQKHRIDTSTPDYTKLNEATKQTFLTTIEQPTLPTSISLYQGYALLQALNDQIGNDFMKQQKKNLGILTARNTSILAHGFEPIGKRLADGILTLAKETTIRLYAIENRDFKEEYEKVKHPQTPKNVIS